MRRSGLLLPVFSLPSDYGIGTMGRQAREFVDFLRAAGQSYWQILPLGPTSYGDSPYQSYSSWAGNPYFIDLDELCRDGLLEPEEFRGLDWGADVSRVDYGRLYELRFSILRRACARLCAAHGPAVEDFCRENAAWLDDYALFMALKDAHGGAPWQQWPEGLRLREPAALASARRELAAEIRFWQTVQYLFYAQWQALRRYANARGVAIIGDLPIYVAPDSADVWAHREQFQLDAQGACTEVAGCPPDGFSALGQRWGNPLFDWEHLRATGYRWWIARIAHQFRLYDVLRIDHFRGFDAYYAIPRAAESAAEGRWRPGPGLDFFRTVEEALGRREIIAEDLGFLSDSVRQLVRDTGYPGMKVLELAFDSRDGSGSDYLPHRCGTHCVMYTGTHDNDTICGWLQSAPAQDTARARAYLCLNAQEGEHWGMMRAALGSPADLVILQTQDLLGLGSEARINTPSQLGGNWLWRLTPGALDGALASRLYQETELYERLPRVE